MRSETGRHRRASIAGAAAAALLLALSGGCAMTPTDPPTAPAQASVTLSGTAAYRERIALPPDARLIVAISDVSRMDAAATVLAQTERPTEGKQVPLAFALDYDPARIDPRGRYSVSARITDGSGQLMWITDTHVALPAPGGTVELHLVRVTR